MKSIQQPFLGLIQLACTVFGAIAFSVIGQYFFRIELSRLSVYALFFVWTAFLISLSDQWPLNKVAKPLAGFIFLITSLVGGLLHVIIIKAFGLSDDIFWPLISNLFLGIGVIIAFNNRLVKDFTQPKSLLLNITFCYTLAITILLAFGFVSSLWFAPFVYVMFWLEQWPLSASNTISKGILTFTIIGGLSLFLIAGFSLTGTSFFKPDAGLWFVIWVWWLVATSWQFEQWPFKNKPQPLKGIIGLLVTIILTFLSYYIIVSVFRFNLAKSVSYIWILVSWLYLWEIVFTKWPGDKLLIQKNL